MTPERFYLTCGGCGARGDGVQLRFGTTWRVLGYECGCVAAWVASTLKVNEQREEEA